MAFASDDKHNAQMALYCPEGPINFGSVNLYLMTFSACNEAACKYPSGCVWMVPGTCEDDPAYSAAHAWVEV